MQYAQGSIGRVFLMKFENDDVLVSQIEKFARSKRIRSAVMVFLGALKKGDIVCGPRKPVMPPQPCWVKFKDGWETLGVATVFSGPGGPQVHIHSSLGKKRKTLTGCIRKDSRVFGVIEAVMLELRGIRATKAVDPATGINLLKILSS